MGERDHSRFQFLSLFSGFGGLDLGFTQTGFRCVGAFDNDKNSIETYNANFSAPATRLDVATDDLPITTPPDVLLAGPPCQGFSTFGPQDMDDPRNQLLGYLPRFTEALKPSVVVVELVPGALSPSVFGHVRDFRGRLENLSFRTKLMRCLATDFGMAQKRKRLILLAWKRGPEQLPALEHSPPKTLHAVLRGVNGASDHTERLLDPESRDGRIAGRIGPGQKLSNVRGGSRAVHTWDIPEVFGETTSDERRLLDRIRLLRRRNRQRPRGDADPVPLNLLLDDSDMGLFPQNGTPPMTTLIGRLITAGYLRSFEDGSIDLTNTFNGKYHRLKWDDQTPTVNTRFGQARYFLHPEEQRGFTVREAARIQGFPDRFRFEGGLTQKFRGIGNAVPPPVAGAVANSVAKILRER